MAGTPTTAEHHSGSGTQTSGGSAHFSGAAAGRYHYEPHVFQVKGRVDPKAFPSGTQ